MNFRPFFAILLFLLGMKETLADPDSLRKSQITIRLENDAYIPGRMDRYYSNGIKLDFHHYLRTGKSFSFTLGKEMYTPDLREDKIGAPIDRPFVGLVFFETGIQWRKNRWFYEISALGGLMGPQSGIDRLHIWYHELAGFPKPIGWEEQLPNSILVNFYAGAKVHLLGNSIADITLSGRAALGNWDQSLQVGPIFRLGKLLPLSVSQLNGSRVGSTGKSLEQYFQLGFFARQTFWNGSIDGGNFRQESGFQASSQSWSCTADLVLNYKNIGFSYGLSFQGRDTPSAENHIYGKIMLHWLF